MSGYPHFSYELCPLKTKGAWVASVSKRVIAQKLGKFRARQLKGPQRPCDDSQQDCVDVSPQLIFKKNKNL